MQPYRTIATFLVGFLATVILWPGNLSSEPLFNDGQKKEMHQIIRDYLISNPEILREAFEALERKEQADQEKQFKDEISRNADQVYRSEFDFVAGNPDGNVTMVEFFDYNCGFCKKALGDVLTLLETDKELRFVVKEYPILGPNSLFASRAAIASKKQGKYWPFHLAMMKARGTNDERQVMRIAKEVGLDVDRLRKDMDDDAVVNTIERSLQMGQALGIQGTPAFLIDDRLIPGALGLEALRQQILEVRETGCAVC